MTNLVIALLLAAGAGMFVISTQIKNKGSAESLAWGSMAFTMLGILLAIEKLFHIFLLNFILENAVVWCTLLWWACALIAGKLEAYYYAHEVSSSLKENFNEHTTFTLQRAIVLVLIYAVLRDWVLLLCISAQFSFWHDGMYYTTRNKLDGSYFKGWWGQSTTSTALTTKYLTPVVRSAIFVIGLCAEFYFALNK